MSRMKKIQKEAQRAKKLPPVQEIQEYLSYILLNLELSPKSAKSICLLSLIYLERVIQKCQTIHIKSFKDVDKVISSV